MSGLLLTFLLFALSIACMAIGVMRGQRPLHGRCGTSGCSRAKCPDCGLKLKIEPGDS